MLYYYSKHARALQREKKKSYASSLISISQAPSLVHPYLKTKPHFRKSSYSIVIRLDNNWFLALKII